MDDLITAVATIQGAQIQANYALWAAVISAIIGAIGIVFAAWYAWQSGIKLHQHNNIIEAKRDVYLDAIAKYHQLANDLKLFKIKIDEFNEILLNNRRDFLSSINKVQLICATNNKKIVFDFKDSVEEKVIELLKVFPTYLQSYYLKIDSEEKLLLAKTNRDKYYEQTQEKARGRIIFDAHHHLTMKKLNEEVDSCDEILNSMITTCQEELTLVNLVIEGFDNDLEEKYKRFSDILRSELKIEN